MEEIETKETKVLLFSGAGLSCPLGLPMTTGFNSVINNGDRDLLKLLKSYLEDDFNDIEAVLTAVEELNKDGIIYKYIQSQNQNQPQRIGQSRGSSSLDVKTINSNILSLREKAKTYSTALKKSVYNLLKNTDTKKSVDLYYNILMEIRSTIVNPAISFFTANYDLTFEEAIEGMGEKKLDLLGISDVNYGFVNKRNTLVFDDSDNYEWKVDALEYKKIHGSLGWNRNKSGRVSCSDSPTTPDDPNSVPILYPGFKGVPDQEPFVFLHNQFLQRLITADYAIFMGFAFRDPYINTLVEMALQVNRSLKILCYNPAKIEELPAESKTKYFDDKYKAFTYVQQGVDIKKNPLSLDLHINTSDSNKLAGVTFG